MKRTVASCMILLLSLLLSTCSMTKDEQPDYIEEMVEAAVNADFEKGHEAETLYRQHISALGSEDTVINFNDLFLLAKFIQLHSGTYKNNETFMLCVGEVALNRLSSREFPNTLEEVVFQPGEFEGVESDDFKSNAFPSRNCVELALRLLQGERLLAPHVVRWSTEAADRVYATFCDRQQNFVYFCESEYPRFYHLPNKKPA